MEVFLRARSNLREKLFSQRAADIWSRARAGLGRRPWSGQGADLLARAKSILLSPRTAWPAIAEESTDIGALYARYILPLAAIPPLCKLIGWSLLLSYMGFGIGLVSALLSYGLGLAAIAVLALVACRLAALFGGEADLVRAFQLMAYSATPSWLGGVFRVVPGLGVLSMLMSLYSIYLLYTGARPLLVVPEDRVVGYTLAVVAAAAIVFALIALVLTAFVGVKMIGMV